MFDPRVFSYQIAAAFGGFNKIDFLTNESFILNPVIISNKRKEESEEQKERRKRERDIQKGTTNQDD